MEYKIVGIYFNNLQNKRFIKVSYNKKPLGWKAVYFDKKGYFTFENVINNKVVRSYFLTNEDKKIIKGLLI